MNADPAVFEDAMQAAAVLGAALARFDNALDRLREQPGSPGPEKVPAVRRGVAGPGGAS